VDKALDRSKSTRRDLLRLAGAAAIGAAGASALSATRVARAAGSGATIGAFFNPLHIASGHLAPNAEVVIGPFPYPGSTVFTSQNYIGIVGNLTARRWKGAGWMSIRSTDFAFDPAHQGINLNFSGAPRAWSNWFICQFGFTFTPGPDIVSNGQFIIRNGPSHADYVVDLHGFLTGDQ
jgi:hypothetical protein